MNDHRHDDFDRKMRALYARAVEQVPSRTTYQLRLRREAAARSPASAPRSPGWWLAAGAAAVFALAIGLRLPGPVQPSAGDPPPTLAAMTEAAETVAFEDSVAALDEDPDLYLWLASQDSQFLAME